MVNNSLQIQYTNLIFPKAQTNPDTVRPSLVAGIKAFPLVLASVERVIVLTVEQWVNVSINSPKNSAAQGTQTSKKRNFLFFQSFAIFSEC